MSALENNSFTEDEIDLLSSVDKPRGNRRSVEKAILNTIINNKVLRKFAELDGTEENDPINATSNGWK